MRVPKIVNSLAVRLMLIGMILFLVGLPELADACTNSEINVGVLDSPEGRIIGDILVVIILERSGVRPMVKYFADTGQLDAAVRNKKVEIILENTDNALNLINIPLKEDPLENYQNVKTLYKQDKGLIWLKPLGYTGTTNAINSLLVTEEIIKKFPGLPRVINKLSGLIDNPTLDRLMSEVRRGKKERRVAKDFLVARRLI